MRDDKQLNERFFFNKEVAEEVGNQHQLLESTFKF
jgi:hypothetical protein